MATSNTDRRKAIFAGTPEFAVPSLRELYNHLGIELIGVYTQPDRPAGRGRRQQASPVKRTATELSIPVYQPETLQATEEITAFHKLGADLLVIAAYGLILPQAVIEQPELSVNVHASLLPRWRGAAPIQRAIMAADEHTGISMMRVVEALDAGPVLERVACPIESIDTSGTLHDKLASLGASCLKATIDDYLAGTLTEVPQDEGDVVYAKKITAQDRMLDWQLGASALARQVRALNPTPVATAILGTAKMKVWSALSLPGDGPTGAAPGSIASATDAGIDIATGNGLLRITELQPEGKRAMSAEDFINGFQHLLTRT